MATIHDVALEAGVSPTTVSRYLNKRIELPAATAARIDGAVARLNYRPNLLARRLSTGRTEAIGLVTPDIGAPFFAALAAAVEDEAEAHGYATCISSTRGDRAREVAALERLGDRHVDGLILVSGAPDDGTLASLIAGRRTVVLVGEDIPDVAVPRVFVENFNGAYAATHALIEAGHRTIACLLGPEGMLSVAERQQGFLAAMADAGLGVRRDHLRTGSFSAEAGGEATRALLRTAIPPTAILATGEGLAAGALSALRQAGLSVPRDVSLVGFADTPFAELFDPPLTVVRQPVEALGRAGFLALFELLNGREPPMQTRLPATLLERESVAPPRHGGF